MSWLYQFFGWLENLRYLLCRSTHEKPVISSFETMDGEMDGHCGQLNFSNRIVYFMIMEITF